MHAQKQMNPSIEKQSTQTQPKLPQYQPCTPSVSRSQYPHYPHLSLSFTYDSRLHLHKQPFLTGNLGLHILVWHKVIERCEPEANPAEILCD
jgi:hypothetical protein